MKHFSLFSGIGGFELGIGEEIVGYSEIDKYASAIYKYHFPDARNYGDATKIDTRRLPEFDLFTFGYPCQDNSIAGKRKGQREDTRSGLITQAIRILGDKKPKYFIAENVPGLFSVSEGCDFYETIRMFAEVGYDCGWQVLNTRWFLPQNRERIYFVGHIRGQSRPKVFPIGETDGLHQEANGQVAHAIDSNYHKGWLDKGQRTMILHTAYKGKPRLYSEVSPTISTQTGGGHLPLVAKTIRTGGINSPYRSRQCWDKYLVDGQIRRLTPIECERLQGFPDNWTKWGLFEDGKIKEISDTQRYKCLGNAVSVPVVKAVWGKINDNQKNGKQVNKIWKLDDTDRLERNIT